MFFEKGESSYRQKMDVEGKRVDGKFDSKMWVSFVLTQENANSQRFHFKGNRKSIGSSKKQY